MSHTTAAPHRSGEQDVDLTSSGLEHRIAEVSPLLNGNTTGVNGVHPNGLTNDLTNGTNGHTPKSGELDASKLTIELADPNARQVPDEATACSGTETICTDHMITCTWKVSSGWEAPALKPYGPLSLMPTASVLHYATECFEGLKCFRGFDGKLRLFRPNLNANRMLMSTLRISLPGFNPEELEKLIAKLVEVDGPKWLSKSRPGSFLYLRPAMIGTQPQLGVQAPKEALLFITASFMPRMDAPAGGMKLHTSPEDQVRAWVGGFGYAKVGANYGPSLLATNEARARGFGQILWLYGPNGECTEAGASNFFILWRAKETGKLQLVTAPLDDRLILDGVTRRSCVELARERLAGELEVVERKYTIDEVLEADKEGRIVEAFAAGTAFFICPVSLIHHRGVEVQIPMGKTGESGMYTAKIKGWLKDIMYGNEQHPWGPVVTDQ
ncbi:aminotransferase [Rhypophila decipiens]|uniref:Branched-chain-amino-acid aminotransferase n=1 Tax=Rhypophila decipiens TaxID=261697 RepID=A0AAN6YK43_9PEZI|nr:aminotransferase [Rhypophila decipiens]